MLARKVRIVGVLLVGALLAFGCKATIDEEEPDTFVVPDTNQDTTTADTGGGGWDTYHTHPRDTFGGEDTARDTTQPDTAPPDLTPPDPEFNFPFTHRGEAPWGVKFEIVEVGGGSGSETGVQGAQVGGRLKVGDNPYIIVRITDNLGAPYKPWDLNVIEIGMTGPSTHMAILYTMKRVGQLQTAFQPVLLNDGSDEYGGVAWRYDFPGPIPETFAKAANDTPDIGPDAGDWGGQGVPDGTYLIAVSGYLNIEVPIPTREGGAATTWVLLGEATEIELRERVLHDNCSKCHGPKIIAHGGNRTGDYLLCIACHVQGAEDRYSSEAPTTTPGNTVFMPTMVHRIHSGANDLRGYPTIFNGFPSDPTKPGYPNYNEKDYSHVVFPQIPLSVGNCAACHGGAAQGDVQGRGTRNACGACHDKVDWSTGAGHGEDAAGVSTVGSTPDDTRCGDSLCHPPTSVVLDHVRSDIRFDPNRNPGLSLEILEVTGATGVGGRFQTGDPLNVKFKATFDAGSAAGTAAPFQEGIVDPNDSSRYLWAVTAGYFTLAGPLEHMTTVLNIRNFFSACNNDAQCPTGKACVFAQGLWGCGTPGAGGLNPGDTCAVNGDCRSNRCSSTVCGNPAVSLASVEALVNEPGTYLYRNLSGIPATYPMQANNTDAFGVADGDWGGLDLAPGTYRVGLNAVLTLPVNQLKPEAPKPDSTVRYPAVGTKNIVIGAGGQLTSRQIVRDENCASCHANLWFHGDQRSNTAWCAACHTQGSEGKAGSPYRTSVELGTMIHKIHRGEELENGYLVIGYHDSVNDFGEVIFTRMDGGTAACEACHVAGTQNKPNNVVCGSCHDSSGAAAHMALNTDATYGEACGVCHGPDKSASVEEAHHAHAHVH